MPPNKPFENKALIKLIEYRFTKDEFDELHEDIRAGLAITCYAASEVNSLMKLYIFANHKFINDGIVDLANYLQRNVILRTWSAKLFEFSEFITLSQKFNKTKNEQLQAICLGATKSFDILRSRNGYETARFLRHEAANHYSLQAARKNLDYVSINAKLSFYLHEMTGNSFYPMGEEVMFIGRMNRGSKHIITKEEKIAFHKDWYDWNIAATKWLDQVQSEFVKKIIIQKFPDRFAQEMTVYLPLEMVGESKDTLTPVFLRKSD